MFNYAQALNALNNSKLSTTNPPAFQCLNYILDGLKDLGTPNQIDFGTSYANSGDTGGTRINFNTPFQSAVVIPVARDTAVDIYVTVDAVTNTFFSVFAFNNAGTRQSCIIDWIAYGVKN